MSKNISVKLFICSLLTIIIFNSMYLPVSFAKDDFFVEGTEFLLEANTQGVINTEALQKTSHTIYNTFFAIAVMVAIIVAMVLGIQFMAASADEKAKVKEALMPFVVGCFVVFGSFTIWKVVVNIGNKAETSIFDYVPPGDSGDSSPNIGYIPNMPTLEPPEPEIPLEKPGGIDDLVPLESKYHNRCGTELEDSHGGGWCPACESSSWVEVQYSVNCFMCASNNVIQCYISRIENCKDSEIIEGSGKKSDVYCYNCDRWLITSYEAGKEYKLSDASEEIQEFVNKNKQIEPDKRPGIRLINHEVVDNR